jgi:hypothetical protein
MDVIFLGVMMALVAAIIGLIAGCAALERRK